MTLKEFVAGVKEWCRKYLQKGADTLFLPLQVLQEYVRLVEDVETRLNLATKYKCHDVVIDVSPCCVCAERGQEPALSPQLSHANLLPCAWWGLLIPESWENFQLWKCPLRSDVCWFCCLSRRTGI